jgi:hypothetical protein
VLNVRFLDPKGQGASAQGDAAKKPSKFFGPRPENCTTIYVGNLAYDITDEVLRKVFEKCGDVKAIRFAEHIQTKEFRGFGYVQFYEGQAVEEAVKLDGMIVMGRPMNIDYGDRDEATTKMREDLHKKLKKGICNKFQMGQCDRGDECKFAHILKDQDAEEVIAAAVEATATGIKRTSTSTPILNPLQREKQESTQASSISQPNSSSSDAPVCINYQKGKCKRGVACRFQHLDGAGESFYLTTAPVATGTQETTPSSKKETVVQPTEAEEDAPICQNFVKGKCKRGAKCRFRHIIGDPDITQDHKDKEQEEEEEEEEVLSITTASSSYHSSRLVGPRVERSSVEVVPEISICLNFQKGTCRRGASCRFAHLFSTPTTKTTKEVEEVSLYQKRFQSICYNWQKSRSCIRGDKCPFVHEENTNTMSVKEDKAEEEEKDINKKKKKKSKKMKRNKVEENEDEDKKKKTKKKKIKS